MGRRRKIITTVYLDPEQLENLGKLATMDNTTKSEIIREALEDYLKKREGDLNAVQK